MVPPPWLRRMENTFEKPEVGHFVRLNDGNEECSQSGGCPLTTNNEMELYAIYAAMLDFLDNANPDDSLVICSDSAYCINIYTRWVRGWQRRGWVKGDGKAIQNLKIIQTTYKLMDKIKDLQFKKVKGHFRDKFNRKADVLAVNAKKIAKKTGKTIGYNQKNDSLLARKEN